VAPERVSEVLARAADAQVPAREIGTTGGSALSVGDVPELPLATLRTAWEGTLPALFS
jgi:phosphoribosylformylglycinamidine synthase subunit PurL